MDGNGNGNGNEDHQQRVCKLSPLREKPIKFICTKALVVVVLCRSNAT